MLFDVIVLLLSMLFDVIAPNLSMLFDTIFSFLWRLFYIIILFISMLFDFIVSFLNMLLDVIVSFQEYFFFSTDIKDLLFEGWHFKGTGGKLLIHVLSWFSSQHNCKEHNLQQKLWKTI